MKNILFLLLIFGIFSCKQMQDNASKASGQPAMLEKKVDNNDWLLGQWKRLNEEEGRETFENWEKIDDSNYQGFGYTMAEGDTVWQESMLLRFANDHWNLHVNPSNESSPTIFNGSSHSKSEFTVENKENDFPSKIKYWKNGKNLNALISNEEMEILFEFEKISQ